MAVDLRCRHVRLLMTSLIKITVRIIPCHLEPFGIPSADCKRPDGATLLHGVKGEHWYGMSLVRYYIAPSYTAMTSCDSGYWSVQLLRHGRCDILKRIISAWELSWEYNYENNNCSVYQCCTWSIYLCKLWIHTHTVVSHFSGKKAADDIFFSNPNQGLTTLFSRFIALDPDLSIPELNLW